MMDRRRQRSRRYRPSSSGVTLADECPAAPRVRAALTAIFILACSSCAPTDEPPLDGVVTHQLVEALRFPAHRESPLTLIRDLAVGSDGSVTVVDWQSVPLFRFAPDGRFLGTVGGQGDGPGEFQRPYGVGFLGDTLWVVDAGSNIVTRFDREGEALDTERPLVGVALPEGLMMPSIVNLLPGRSVLVVGLWDIAGDRSTYFRIGRDGVAYRILDLDGSTRWWTLEIPGQGRSGTSQHQPFAPYDLVRVWEAGERIVIIERPQPESPESAAYTVRMFTDTGEVEWEVSVPYVPEPLEDPSFGVAIDGWMGAGGFADVLLGRGLFPSEQALREALVEDTTRPKYLPPIPNVGGGVDDRGVLVTESGEVWLQRWTDQAQPLRWDVVGPGGRIRIVRGPAEAQLHVIRGAEAWGVVVDDFDVPTIVRYRIEEVV